MKTPHMTASSIRVGAALLLAGACFQAGRWTGQLEREAVDHAFAAAREAALGALPVKAAAEATPKLVEPAPATTAQGEPVGEPGDLITPLNVRDPSALILRPMDSHCAPPPPDTPAVPEAKPLKKPLPEGKLLDLLKKHKDKSEEPKVY